MKSFVFVASFKRLKPWTFQKQPTGWKKGHIYEYIISLSEGRGGGGFHDW